MKFSSISSFLGSSYKMTNENVRFFSHFWRRFSTVRDKKVVFRTC